MKKSKLKSVANTLFLVCVFALTLWSVFRGQDLERMMEHIVGTNPVYVLLGVGCVILFVLGEATVIWYLLRTLGTKVRLSRCCLYSFIGFFYSGITPSASGGQPFQIMAMRKDKIPVAVSTVVLAIVTITYKSVLVVIGLAVLLIAPPQVMLYLEPSLPIIHLGMGLNVIFISILFLLVFSPKLVRRVIEGVMKLINKIRPFRNPERQYRRVDRMIAQYQGSAEFFVKHKRVILNVFAITFIQRLILFLVTWLTYLAFELSGHGMALITILQAMISVAADMLPIPGGMGVSENMFMVIFEPIFKEQYVLPGMVISRGISYYTQLIICGIMTVVSSFLIKDKRQENGEKHD